MKDKITQIFSDGTSLTIREFEDSMRSLQKVMSLNQRKKIGQLPSLVIKKRVRKIKIEKEFNWNRYVIILISLLILTAIINSIFIQK